MTRTVAIAWQARLFPTVALQECRPTLPDICLNLRASLNGAADPWPDEELRDVVLMLQARLDTWGTPSDALDAHVRGMMQQAIWLGRAAEAERLTEQPTGGTI